MLTPVEIQSKTFKSGGLGYDKKDVDQFLREVLANYEQLYRENMELTDKASVLNDGIQYYKGIEKTLQKALLLAEKTAEETKLTAQKEATRIVIEANTKASLITSDSRNQLDKIHLQTVNLVQQYESYRLQFKNLAKSQFELLESPAFQITLANLDAFMSMGTPEVHKKPLEEQDQDLQFIVEAAATSDKSKEEVTKDFISQQKDTELKKNTDHQDDFDFFDLNDSEE